MHRPDTVTPAPPAQPAAGPASTSRTEVRSLSARVAVLSRTVGGPLLLAVVVQNATNFAFHAVVGRALGPDEYGALGAVLAVMVLLSVPLSAVQAAASAAVAQHGWDRSSVRGVLTRGSAVAAAVAVLVLAAAGAVRDFYRLGSLVDAAVLAPFLAVSVVLALARGALLGDGRVRATAATYLVGAVSRFALGVLLLGRWGVTGAIVGTLAGEVLALVAALVAVGSRTGAVVTSYRLGVRAVLLSCAAVTALFLFSTVDLLLARHFLVGDASGEYTAAATVAKTVLALPAAAVSVFFPRLVVAWRHGDPRVLRTAMLVVCGLAAVGAAVVALMPGAVLWFLYGDGYAGSAGLVRLLALVAAATSVVSVLTYASLARRAATMAVPAVGALLEVVLIWANHGSPAAIAAMSLVALVPTVAVMSVWETNAWYCARTRRSS